MFVLYVYIKIHTICVHVVSINKIKLSASKVCVGGRNFMEAVFDVGLPKEYIVYGSRTLENHQRQGSANTLLSVSVRRASSCNHK